MALEALRMVEFTIMHSGQACHRHAASCRALVCRISTSSARGGTVGQQPTPLPQFLTTSTTSLCILQGMASDAQNLTILLCNIAVMGALLTDFASQAFRVHLGAAMDSHIPLAILDRMFADSTTLLLLRILLRVATNAQLRTVLASAKDPCEHPVALRACETCCMVYPASTDVVRVVRDVLTALNAVNATVPFYRRTICLNRRDRVVTLVI